MPYLMLKEVPRYECLQAATARVPGANPAICEVFLNILHTGDVVSRGESDFLARHGLNQARLIILVLLDSSENGSMRSSELAEHANVSRATITGLLDTLERAGLVARAADTRDRRASCVTITEKGKALLHKVQPMLIRWTEKILSALSVREQGQLVTLLRKTQRAFTDRGNDSQS
ncbi:MAG TPA: MarR family transcriptional regulator [Terrimicrobium sp.]